MTQKSRAGHSTSISALDYGDKTLFVLAGASGGVSLCSFTTVNDTSTGIASASNSLVFFCYQQWNRQNVFENNGDKNILVIDLFAIS